MTEENTLEIDTFLEIDNSLTEDKPSTEFANELHQDEGEINNESKPLMITNCESNDLIQDNKDEGNRNRKRKLVVDEKGEEECEYEELQEEERLNEEHPLEEEIHEEEQIQQQPDDSVNTKDNDDDDESNTKKAALERLRNMKFAVKDPFKDNPYSFFYFLIKKSTDQRNVQHLFALQNIPLLKESFQMMMKFLIKQLVILVEEVVVMMILHIGILDVIIVHVLEMEIMIDITIGLIF
jgi:hypothetical protein